MVNFTADQDLIKQLHCCWNACNCSSLKPFIFCAPEKKMALYYNYVSTGTSTCVLLFIAFLSCGSYMHVYKCFVFMEEESTRQNIHRFHFKAVFFFHYVHSSCDLLSVQFWVLENTSTLNSAQKIWLCNLHLHMSLENFTNFIPMWYYLLLLKHINVFSAWLIWLAKGSMEKLEITFQYFAWNIMNVCDQFIVSYVVYFKDRH